MLQSLVDFPKQLPRTLICLGIGSLNFYFWHKLRGTSSPPPTTVTADDFSGDPIVNSFVQAAVFFIFAYAVGTLAIYIGNWIAERREKEEDRVLREIYLFETGNSLLVQRYQDAILRSELIFGLFSSILFNTLVLVAFPVDLSSPHKSTQMTWYQTATIVLFWVIVLILTFAARAPLEAIDRVLKSRYPEIVAKKSP